MPEMNGVDFLKALRKLQPNTVRLMLTSAADVETAMTAINDAEVFRFIKKPWHVDLRDSVQAALDRHLALSEEQRLADEQRVHRGALSAAELELSRLEASEPGITKVNWGPDGSVLLEDL